MGFPWFVFKYVNGHKSRFVNVTTYINICMCCWLLCASVVHVSVCV